MSVLYRRRDGSEQILTEPGTLEAQRLDGSEDWLEVSEGEQNENREEE
jgi:hypothetical protein